MNEGIRIDRIVAGLKDAHLAWTLSLEGVLVRLPSTCPVECVFSEAHAYRPLLLRKDLCVHTCLTGIKDGRINTYTMVCT